MPNVDLAPGLRLPPEAMLQRFAILGMSGAGKSNIAAVMAEQMYAAELPWCVIDPKGDWWGLRSSKTGKSGGLDVPIFGGLHGDIPLYEDGGKVMAKAVANELTHSILDVSEFESKASMIRFLTDFAEALYRANRTPLMVFLEEADEFIPQKTNSPAEAKSVGVWSRMVKRGRTRGLFTTLIAQRNAELAKAVLNQSDTVIAMRATAKLDRDAVKGWVEHSGAAAELVDSLPSLDDGEGWLSSPQKLKLTKRFVFDRRHTFDSGGTPTLDGAREAVKLANLDLGALEGKMKDTIERAKAEDPAELKKQIAELRADIAKLEAAEPPPPPPPPDPIEIQVPVFDGEAHAVLSKMMDLRKGLREDAAAIEKVADGIGHDIDRAVELDEARRNAPPDPKTAPPPLPSRRPPPATVSAPPQAAGQTTDELPPLKKAERSILNVLAQFPAGRTKKQVSMLTGYRVTSGGFRNALTRLRKGNLIVGTEDLQITNLGVTEAGDVQPVPSGAALLAHWKSQFKLAERTILDVLCEAYPHSMSKEQISEATGYSVISGGFRNALTALRKAEVVEGTDPVTASAELFE